MQIISNTVCEKLSRKIKDDFFKPINTYKISIFICGADLSHKEKIRYKIANKIKESWYSILFDLIYPEDIFDELLYSSKSKDLLSLENMLAESVDVVLIIPESPGSFAELGAFANNKNLRKKIVCVIDNNYKKNKSFINQGPIKLIRNSNKQGILFIDTSDISREMSKIVSAVKRTKKNTYKNTNKITLLQLDNFLLTTIYLLEPVNEKVLECITGYAIENESNTFEATKTAISILTKKRFIEYTIDGYILTDLGLYEFNHLRQIRTRIKTHYETIALDVLRLEILNYKLRNRKIKI